MYSSKYLKYLFACLDQLLNYGLEWPTYVKKKYDRCLMDVTIKKLKSMFEDGWNTTSKYWLIEDLKK